MKKFYLFNVIFTLFIVILAFVFYFNLEKIYISNIKFKILSNLLQKGYDINSKLIFYVDSLDNYKFLDEKNIKKNENLFLKFDIYKWHIYLSKKKLILPYLSKISFLILTSTLSLLIIFYYSLVFVVDFYIYKRLINIYKKIKVENLYEQIELDDIVNEKDLISDLIFELNYLFRFYYQNINKFRKFATYVSQIAEHLDYAVAILDLNGIIIYTNSLYPKLLKLSKNAIGLYYYDVIPTSKFLSKRQFSLVLKGERVSYNTKFVIKNEVLEVFIELIPIFEKGEVVRVIHSIKRKGLQDKLKNKFDNTRKIIKEAINGKRDKD